MKTYVTYHLRGNKAPSDIILDIKEHTRPPHWRWTEARIREIKVQIASQTLVHTDHTDIVILNVKPLEGN